METLQGSEIAIPQVSTPIPVQPVQPAQADNDGQLVRLWLHGRPANTIRGYRADWKSFVAFVEGRAVHAVKLADIQAYVDELEHLAPATRARRLNVVRSLFAFAQRIGYLHFNVAAAVRAPAIKDVRAERILGEGDVLKLIAMEPDQRNAAILRLTYGAGLRVSELTGLAWRDVQAREADDTGQITVFGKGGKTRAVVLSSST